MKYFIKGLFRGTLLLVLAPVIVPLMIIDAIYTMGGRLGSPVDGARMWLLENIFGNFD